MARSEAWQQVGPSTRSPGLNFGRPILSVVKPHRPLFDKARHGVVDTSVGDEFERVLDELRQNSLALSREATVRTYAPA